MRTALRLLLGLLCTLALLVVSSPWWIYVWGLSRVEGRPERPVVMASAEDQARVWKFARGEGAPQVESINPYGAAIDFWRGDLRPPPGERVAMWVARSHLMDQQRSAGMLSWHGSYAALTIWLTRNWTAEELMTAASRSPMVQRWMDEQARRNRQSMEHGPAL